VTWIGLFPRAARTSSRPVANRKRFRIVSAEGVLSMPARAATSEAVSSSSEKCSDNIISSKRLLDLDQRPGIITTSKKVLSPGILPANAVVTLPAMLCRKRYSHK